MRTWTIIGASATVLAVVVTLGVFLLERTSNTAKLEVAEISRTTLVNPDVESSKRKIEIKYDGRDVSDLMVFHVRVGNTGGKPIRSSDYEAPLRLTVKHVKEILWAEQTSANPNHISVGINIDKQTIQASNTLLNPGDWYILEFAVLPEAEISPDINPRGRIVGINAVAFSKIEEKQKKEIFGFKVDEILYLQIITLLVALAGFISASFSLLFVRRIPDREGK